MRLLSFVFIAFAFLFSASSSFAHAKSKKPVEGSAYFKFISATTQRTMPGMRDVEPSTTERILVVWKSTKEPGQMFYKPGTDGWLMGQVSRVHYIRDRKLVNGELPYTTEEVTAGMIKKGDTLEIVPTPGGRYGKPSIIPASMVSTLFFQVRGEQWYYFKIKKWTKLPDILMP